MPRYQVELERVTKEYAYTSVVAKTEAEADEKAEALAGDETKLSQVEWKVQIQTITVLEVG